MTRHGDLPRSFGREAFGTDPEAYDAVRPAYPPWVFEELTRRRALRPGVVTFEIGAGTGIATRGLIALGAHPVTAIEPDARLAAVLQAISPGVVVRVEAFEDCSLDDGSFDLGFCATAFHWLPEDDALAKIAAALKPGGWWATVWHVFGDAGRYDAFHEATIAILDGPCSPSGAGDGPPFALDSAARIGALERTGAFEAIAHRRESWQLVLDPDGIAQLYSTFSPITARPDRDAVLAELRRIAAEDFSGHVTRNMTTSLYVGRRSARTSLTSCCA